ncbi:hypothetical protein SLEP1_g52986 [Rubroshorea leprosula]|uniref:PGG domain-containing protein n=1 Tax=Rubroshorea leprosula TaxID=152421 RepID=A0AAV5M940_9ROSI|nr:hypothetical protein SLEP1_g52986 [Rubroshorea leprosula]
MDERLLEAAIVGDVVALDDLLKEDPLVLWRVSLSSRAETPLHVASLAGHVDFVRKIMEVVPSFAQELNKDGFAPIHLATAAGHLEVVKELLNKANSYLCLLNSDLCLLKDKAGRTALHLAAIKGRVDIIDDLLSHCSHKKAMEQVTLLGETVLHLAVKNSQFKAFKVLFEASERLVGHDRRVNAKDNEGKTVLEIAIATNQLQDKDLLPVMATMIAAATFQAGLNPPSTIWENGVHLDNKCIITTLNYRHAGDLLGLKSCPASRFYGFMLCNTLAFAASIVLIPFRQDTRMAPPLTMISLFFLLFTYLTFLGTISPNVSLFGFIYVVMALSIFLLFLYVPFKFSLIHLFRKRSRRTNLQEDASSGRR